MKNKVVDFTLDLENVVGQPPENLLLHHGPSKLLINSFHYHSPSVGIVASYVPTDLDVKDHFNVFRGVDQIESFSQAMSCCSTFLQSQKEQKLPKELKETILPYFIGIGNVTFHGVVEKGDTIVHLAQIKFYKFRQIVCNGRTYKVSKGLNLDDYFKDFTDEQLLNHKLSQDFSLTAEYNDITGRGIKINKYN